MKNWRNIAVFNQFAKYSLSGVFLTLFYAALYTIFTRSERSPLVAHVVAYAISIALGFFLNRYWSFRGHGGQNSTVTSSFRFTVVSLLGFAINSFFVWFITGPVINGPDWWPLLPIIFITPIVTFSFNRKWTFS